jgi:hypothetical protein
MLSLKFYIIELLLVTSIFYFLIRNNTPLLLYNMFINTALVFLCCLSSLAIVDFGLVFFMNLEISLLFFIFLWNLPYLTKSNLVYNNRLGLITPYIVGFICLFFITYFFTLNLDLFFDVDSNKLWLNNAGYRDYYADNYSRDVDDLYFFFKTYIFLMTLELFFYSVNYILIVILKI